MEKKTTCRCGAEIVTQLECVGYIARCSKSCQDENSGYSIGNTSQDAIANFIMDQEDEDTE
jgi:hypothetical protein